MTVVEQEILTTLETLDDEDQKRVLDYARSLSHRLGTPFSELRQVAAEIAFPKEDLAEIARFIEEEFRQVRGDELDVPSFDN